MDGAVTYSKDRIVSSGWSDCRDSVRYRVIDAKGSIQLLD